MVNLVIFCLHLTSFGMLRRLFFLTCCCVSALFSQHRALGVELYVTSPAPPQVSISHPEVRSEYVVGMMILVRAEITPDATDVREVRFTTQDALINVVTNAPYSTWLDVRRFITQTPVELRLAATAVTRSGTTITSPPVRIFILGGPPQYFEYEIVTPRDGDVFLPGHPFICSVDLLAKPTNGAYFTQLLLGTNVLGSFVTDNVPYSIAVTNLPSGEYTLTVDDRNASSRAKPVHIRVADLAIHHFRAAGETLSFDVLTAYPERETVIQSSINLTEWTSISTNITGGNLLSFIDPRPFQGSPRFYRLLIPPE